MTLIDTISPTLFRSACGQFATGVAIATTLSADGDRLGLTINSFSSVSLDPALVLFSIDKSASSHDAFLSAPHFAINVLSEDQRALSNRFASAAETDRFPGVDLIPFAPETAPILAGCLSHFLCDLETTVPGGDHTILIGRVTRIGLTEDRAAKPLLYFSGGYASLGS